MTSSKQINTSKPYKVNKTMELLSKSEENNKENLNTTLTNENNDKLVENKEKKYQ